METILSASIRDAGGSAQDLGSSLQEAVAGAAEESGSALQEQLSSSIAAVDASIPLVEVSDVETSIITTEIEAAAEQADTFVTITNVDASAVGEAIEQEAVSADPLVDFGQVAGETSEQLEELAAASDKTGGSMNLMGTASNVAGGNFGTLVKVIGKGNVAAIGASGAFTTLAGRAIKGQEAQARFNKVFGEFSEEIEAIDIGGLNVSLGDLAVQTGSAGGGLRDAASKLGTMGQSAGVSAKQVAQTAEQVLVLANHLAATNPSLGTAEQIAARLTPALRGGARAGLALGISFDQVEHKARAMQIATADGRTEVTAFDKIAAGAAIRTEQLGNRLGTDIAEGSRSATVQMRSLGKQASSLLSELGKPLVAPLLGLVKDLAAAISVLNAEIPGLDTSLVKLAGGSLTGSTSGISGFQLSVKGLIAELTGNEAAVQANLEAMARIPGAGGEAARSILEQQAAIRTKREEQEKATRADALAGEAIRQQLGLLGLSLDALKGKEVNLVALQEAQKQMADQFVQSIPPVSATLADFAKDTETSIKEVIKQFREQNEAFANFMPNLKTIIQKGGADLALAIQAMGPQQGAAFARMVATSSSKEIAALEVQTDQRNQFLNTAGEASGSLTALAFQAGATSTPALQASFEGGKKIGESAVAGTQQAAVESGPEVVGFWEKLGGDIRIKLEEAGETIAGFFSVLPGRILGAIQALPEGVGMIVSNVTQFFVELPPKVGEALSQAASGIGTFFASLPGKASEGISNMVRSIGIFGPEIFRKAKELGSKLVTGAAESITELPGKVFKSIQDIINGVGNFFKDLFEAGKKVAKKFIDGFLKGFTSSPESKMEVALAGAFERMNSMASGFSSSFPPITGQFSVNGSGFTPLAGPSPSGIGGATASSAGVTIEELHVHDVTGDPQATAFAVGTELARRATR